MNCTTEASAASTSSVSAIPACCGCVLCSKHAFLERVRDEVDAQYGAEPISPDDVAALVLAIAAAEAPSLSAFMADRPAVAQMREFAVHRSLCQLRSRSAHLGDSPAPGYGQVRAGDDPDRRVRERKAAMHAELFADSMRASDWIRPMTPISTPCPAPLFRSSILYRSSVCIDVGGCARGAPRTVRDVFCRTHDTLRSGVATIRPSRGCAVLRRTCARGRVASDGRA